jgi:hypothetical protein
MGEHYADQSDGARTRHHQRLEIYEETKTIVDRGLLGLALKRIIRSHV